MPKDPSKKRISPDLTPEEYTAFHAEAVRRDWADKKLCETIIRAFNKLEKKEEFLLLGRKER